MKTHRFDSLSFLAGALITLVGLAFLLPRSWGDLSWLVSRLSSWFFPAVLLVLGLAVLVPALIPDRTDDDQEDRSRSSR